MKFGLIPLNIGIDSLEQMTGLAQLAESAGWESVWTFEHVIVPLDYQSKYPYNASGKMAAAPDTNFIDPLIALTAIATATKSIRLGTGVNILSQSNPLYMAKQAASLDMLSAGRFMLGVGIGWLREEFDAMGVPFERRGARFDDYVVAMKKIWSGEVVEHDSDFLNWHGFQSYPVPAQKPHLPIIMGGNKGKIYQRIARHGDGWFAPTASAAELAPMLDQVKKECEKVGRDYSEIEISAMWVSAAAGLSGIKEYQDIGVHRLIAPIFALGTSNPMEGLEKIGNEVIAKL